MINTRFISTIAVAAALLALPACKKKNETPAPKPPAKPVCRISTITTGSTGISLTYDNDKRIKQVSTASSTNTYTYSGNTVERRTTDAGGVFQGRLEITNNAAGFPTKVQEYDASDVLTSTTVFTYDANNQVQQSTRTPAGGGSPSVTTFIWANGNLSQINGSPTTYTYYTDKPWQQGDYFNIVLQIEQGYVYIKNTNLLKSSGGSTDVTYSFNSDGYITSLVIGSSTLNYTYICD